MASFLCSKHACVGRRLDYDCTVPAAKGAPSVNQCVAPGEQFCKSAATDSYLDGIVGKGNLKSPF